MPKSTKHFISKENLAESLIKSQPGLFVLFNKDGRIQWWNTRLEYYTGYSDEQIKNVKILDLVREQDGKAFQKKIDEAFQTGIADMEIHLKNTSGNTITCLFTCVAVELDDEDYIIATGIDISKMVQERSEKMRYFQVLENSRNEIIMFDADKLNLVYANEGARHNLGYTDKELKGMKASDINPEFNEESFRDHIRPLLNREINNLKFETFHQRSDGSKYDVEINLQLDEYNDHKLLIGIALDITDRLEYERQLESSLREKELLLKEVHHRVKNNLAIVSSLLSLQAGNAQTEAVKKLLEESYSRIRAMAMIHQMLYEQEDVSKIDFEGYLNKLVDYISANYKDPHTRIETEVSARGIKFDIVTAVPCALIVHELITNAFKHACHSQNSCTVKVSLTREQYINKLVVFDDGDGLPAFFDIKESTSLGMTLIQGLTDQLGGKLEVEQDGGTSFIITFKTQSLSA
ncbi:MAG: PAS domain S-box protein [Balneolales bacterium]